MFNLPFEKQARNVVEKFTLKLTLEMFFKLIYLGNRTLVHE